MDHLALPSPVAKRRRSYTSEFRAKVVKASYEPGQSVAGVAQHYQINANMLHRWRKRFQDADNGQASEFIQLPITAKVVDSSRASDTVRIELPGGVVVHWPVNRVGDSIVWLKAIMTP